jgi:hypothetical protein
MTEIRVTSSPLDRYRMPALLAGVVALVLCVIGAFLSRDNFFRSYLIAFIFWWGVTMGTFGLLMLQHMVGGNWGLATRRCLEAAVKQLPLMVLFFIPLLFGLGRLYSWMHEPTDVYGQTTHFRTWWLTPGTFMLRAAIYFAIWIVMSWLLIKWSGEQDRSADPALVQKMKAVSAPGMLILGLTITFAVVDWVMSIDSHWYSTIYGLIFIAGFSLSAMALMVLTLGALRKIEPFAHIARHDVMYDLGNLMMALTMLWAYMSFSQLLIMWSGNTQEDAAYYWHRGIAAVGATGGAYKLPENAIPYEPGGWQWVSLFILVVNFFLPFLLLLARMNKRNVGALVKIAALVLTVRIVDIFWHVIPMFSQQTFHHEQHQPTPLSLASIAMVVVAVVGIGGVWLFFYIGAIKKRPLVPVHDPRLLEVAHSHGH